MTTDQGMERIVRSWLEPGLTTLTDDVLDAVMDQLPATPQRRRWSARRIADMNPLAKYAIATAAVVVIAIVGFNLLAPGGMSDVGGVAPSPSSSPSAGPFTPSPTPTIPLVHDGDLEPGTYRSDIGGRFTFTVPAGWTGSGNAFVAHKGGNNFEDDSDVTMVVWALTHVYADSCNWTGNLVEARTPATMVEALAAQRGHGTVGPTETSLGGYPATRFEFSVPSDFDLATCDSDINRLWPNGGPNEDQGLPIAPGQTTTVYVVDVDGEARVVGGITREKSSAADVAELEAIIDSLQFEP